MEKNNLIKVFDNNAIAYDKFRPHYPSQLIDDLVNLSGIQSPEHILEIGCGTGQLTIDLLKRGYHVVAVEKGKHLAEITRNKLDKFQHGQVVVSAFEDWDSEKRFKLVVSAQAFHWIDKELGFKKVKDLLKKTGSIALIWNIDQSQHTDFWKTSSPIYQNYFPKNPQKKSLGDISHSYQNYLDELSYFKQVNRVEYPWEKRYSKDAYLGLLQTFSDHMTLEEQKRKQFFEAIEKAIELNGNQVEKYYKTVLLFAKRKV